MTNDNRTNEAIIADAITAYWRNEDRSGPNRGPEAHDMECGKAAVEALRAAGRLTGEPGDEQVERAVSIERVMDTLAYYHCRSVNPKADHPRMGYHAMSEDQREFLRERQREAAEEVMRMFATRVQPSPTVDEEKTGAALRKVLDAQEAMHCTRVWGAWRYTMTEDDFVPVTEDQAAIDELVRAVVEAIGGERL